MWNVSFMSLTTDFKLSETCELLSWYLRDCNGPDVVCADSSPDLPVLLICILTIHQQLRKHRMVYSEHTVLINEQTTFPVSVLNYHRIFN